MKYVTRNICIANQRPLSKLRSSATHLPLFGKCYPQHNLWTVPKQARTNQQQKLTWEGSARLEQFVIPRRERLPVERVHLHFRRSSLTGDHLLLARHAADIQASLHTGGCRCRRLKSTKEMAESKVGLVSRRVIGNPPPTERLDACRTYLKAVLGEPARKPARRAKQHKGHTTRGRRKRRSIMIERKHNKTKLNSGVPQRTTSSFESLAFSHPEKPRVTTTVTYA